MKFKFVFFIIFSFFASVGRAQPPTLVLLTSLDLWGKGPFYLRHYYDFYPEQLEKIFRESFEGSGYRLVVQHGANSYHLWQALQNRENAAVFWVSHAGAEGFDLAGIKDIHAVVDQSGFDISDVFKTAHSDLRYLAIVGCNSKGVFEKLQKQGLFERAPRLTVNSFDTEIDAQKGLRKAIEESFRQLPSAHTDVLNVEAEAKTQETNKVTIIRHIPNVNSHKVSPSVRVEIGDKILTVFPFGIPGETQEAAIDLGPLSQNQKISDLKIIINAGGNASVTQAEVDLGTFEFSKPWPGAHWSVFADSNGHPLGVVQNIYRYDGVTVHSIDSSF